MSKLVHNYPGGTTDDYGTDLALNRFLQGDVIEGFAVVANGTPNMTVLVQTGSGRITTGTYPSSYGYLISHDTTAGESVTVPTAAASPRIDYIVAYIDKGVTGSTNPSYVNNTNNVLKFVDVPGTPAGSPLPPTAAQIQTAITSASNPYIILAQIAVGASVTTITNPNITDMRKFVRAVNGLALGTSSYVDNGCVWSISSGLAGTMTAGLVYINVAGVMVPVNLASIATNTFTASQDTYVYVNVFGTVGYLPVANNAASPTLPNNSIWLAKIITNGTQIVATTGIQQGGLDSNAKYIYNTDSSAKPVSVYTGNSPVFGTYYYGIVGGKKRFWGTTAQLNVSGSGFLAGNVTLNLPTFFTQITSVSVTTGTVANTSFMGSSLNSASTSAIAINYLQYSGTNGGATYDVVIEGF